MVQAGNFGPMFYGLADDPEVERTFPGQPPLGIEANLDYARNLIAGVQAEGARYVGTMSMAWNYGTTRSAKAYGRSGTGCGWQTCWARNR